MNGKHESCIDIRVLLELAVETVTPPLNTKGGQLAADIRAGAARAEYVRSPDGWFVPIHDLLARVEDVAELLRFEILQRGGEFDIAGGFEIVTDQGTSLGISPSSNFRFAVDLANTIITLRPESKEREVFVSNQDTWELLLHNDEIRIRVKQGAESEAREFRWPVEESERCLKEALKEVEDFALRLEPVLLAYHDVGMTSEGIQWMFGLDKLPGHADT